MASSGEQKSGERTEDTCMSAAGGSATQVSANGEIRAVSPATALAAAAAFARLDGLAGPS